MVALITAGGIIYLSVMVLTNRQGINEAIGLMKK
jgi:hypothetical protein